MQVCLALEERMEDDEDMRAMNLTTLPQQEVQLLRRLSMFPILEGDSEVWGRCGERSP